MSMSKRVAENASPHACAHSICMLSHALLLLTRILNLARIEQVCDFGLSTKLQGGLKTFCGTAEYIAPEVRFGDPPRPAPRSFLSLPRSNARTVFLDHCYLHLDLRTSVCSCMHLHAYEVCMRTRVYASVLCVREREQFKNPNA